MSKLFELCEQLPEFIESDWDGTNHYELHDASPDNSEYFWLDMKDYEYYEWTCNTVPGKRLGLVFDVAVAAKEYTKQNQTLKELNKELIEALEKSISIIVTAPNSVRFESDIYRLQATLAKAKGETGHAE